MTEESLHLYPSTYFAPPYRNDLNRLRKFFETLEKVSKTSGKTKNEFDKLVKEYRQTLKGNPSQNQLILDFCQLQGDYDFPQDLIDQFISTISTNLENPKFHTLAPVVEYMQNSDEIYGACVATLLKLPKDAHPAVIKLSRALAYLNFIQTILEDIQADRQFIAQSLLQRHGVLELKIPESEKEKRNFRKLIRSEIDRYRKWNLEAKKYFHLIPRSTRTSIKTIAELNEWVAWKIESDPLSIFHKRYYPSKFRKLLTSWKNFLSPM